MNAKISAFVNGAEEIMYLLLYNLHDRTFKDELNTSFPSKSKNVGKKEEDNIIWQQSKSLSGLIKFCWPC